MNTAENRAHWDARASLGVQAGTQDLILAELERRAIMGAIHLRSARRVLEVGCGTGWMARMVAEHIAEHSGSVTAIDSSERMISRALGDTDGKSGAVPLFAVGDVTNPPEGPFEVAYSQRCLINLPSWEAQKLAIYAIADRLVNGGLFLMCEHSQDGLDAINEAREVLLLKPVEAPWHNRYFRDADLAAVTSLRLVECVPFSAAYYFVSRVLNAKLSSDAGEEPAYDAPINQLALTLPAECVAPRFAQGRLWIWEKS